jgi:DNA-binding response OmpR family regulator
MIHIAIVEDNADLLDDIAFNLQQAGYGVTPLLDGAVLDAWLTEHEADVLVLDLGLPGEDGLSIAGRMKQARPGMGIVMLTARGAVDDRVQGLDQGADAYLVKPVDFRELSAVIRTVARRLKSDKEGGGGNGGGRKGWVLNPDQLELIAPDGKPIPLTHSECCVLKAVACADGQLISRRALIEALGHKDWYYDERRLETLISRLRRKLGSHAPDGFPVRGVKGHGYLFGVEVREILEKR